MNDEISRESLLIYLENLRTLETIVHESNKKIRQIHIEFNQKEKELLDWEGTQPSRPEISYLDFVNSGVSNETSYKVAGIFSFFLGIPGILGSISLMMDDNTFLGVKVGCLLFSLFIMGVGIGAILYANREKLRNEEIKERNTITIRDQENKYEKELEEYRKRCSRARAEIIEIEHKHDLIINELDEETTSVIEKLNEAYSINIIPLTFRNIQGIYYLYDYLSTSNQTLSEALMQCNLEAIKQKLDSAINLQGKAIIQQAQANHALFAQNQRILETAQATMNNIAVAAKYAQICAINSTVSLEMQKEQLAYQKADYWLNL